MGWRTEEDPRVAVMQRRRRGLSEFGVGDWILWRLVCGVCRDVGRLGRKSVEGFARAPYRSEEKLGWWLMQCSELRVKLLKLRPRHILARRADVLESIR